MAPNTPSKPRQLERIPANTLVTLLVDPEGQKLRQRARLLDISDTGMKLKTNVELAKGQLVDVLSQPGMLEGERTRVVWVTDAGSEKAFVVGLELLNPRVTDAAGVPSATASQPWEPRGIKDTEGDARNVVGDDRGPMAKE